MHHQHHCRTLASHELGYVGFCEGCRMVNVAFQNSLFCLTLEQFGEFCGLIAERQAMKPFLTTHGTELMLVTPMPNYFLLFSEEELIQLSALLQEAALVLEAERILEQTRIL